jgi:hypothetical protein
MKLNSDRRDVSLLSRLSPFSRRRLESLLGSEFAEQAVRAAERQMLQDRLKLVAELKNLDAEHPRRQAAHESAAERQTAKLSQAERAFYTERATMRALLLAAQGAHVQYLGKRMEIVQQLEAGADPRLEEFIFQAANVLSNELKASLDIWPDPKKLARGISPALSSNIEEYVQAQAALTAAIEGAVSLRHSAASSDEVTRWLEATCESLAAPLAKLEINGPSLTADQQVGPPMTWIGRGAWRTPELLKEGPEERARRSEENARRGANNA